MLLILLPTMVVAKGQVELTISCGRFPMEVELCRKAAEAWADQTGNRVQVLSATGRPERRLELYEELLGIGTERLDVLEIDIVWPARLASHLVDLRGYLDGDEASFLPTLIANNTVDGRLVALPWFVDLGLLYYRSDLLEAAAIPVPPTWPALEDAAMRIQDMKRGGGDSRFWGFVWQGAGGESLTCNVVEWVASWNGGGIVERTGRVSVDNPKAAYALERAARWMGLISPESVLADAEAETLARFAAGNAAFMRHWPYAWQELQSSDSPVRGKVGVALLPKGGVEGQHAATLGGWQLAVSRYSRHPEEAADLVRYLTSVPMQRARAVGHGYLPTRTELPSEPTVLATSPIMRLLGPDSDVVFAVRPSSVTGAWYPEVSQRLQGAALQVLMADLDAEMATASLADARRQRVAFTRPYYVSPARFVSRRGAFADVGPATLKGKRIGVRRGTTFDDYVTDNYAPYAEILRYPTQLGALLDLVLERIDLVIGDQLVLHQTFLATPQGQDYEFVGPLLSDPVWFGAGNAVAVAKNDRGLRTLLDRAVADIHVNGVFERIQRTWFSRDIRGPEK